MLLVNKQTLFSTMIVDAAKDRFAHESTIVQVKSTKRIISRKDAFDVFTPLLTLKMINFATSLKDFVTVIDSEQIFNMDANGNFLTIYIFKALERVFFRWFPWHSAPRFFSLFALPRVFKKTKTQKSTNQLPSWPNVYGQL